MALLSDADPDPTPPSTLRCDSTVGAYKHSDPEKKGKKERREMKDRTRRSGFIIIAFCANSKYRTRIKVGNKSKTSFLFSHPLLSAEPDLNPAANGA